MGGTGVQVLKNQQSYFQYTNKNVGSAGVRRGKNISYRLYCSDIAQFFVEY